MRFLRLFTAILVAATALTAPASASALALEQVGSFERPTYVTSDPHDPNRLFVVEQAGRIQLTEGGKTTTFLDVEPIVHDLNAFGDYGLFSVAFSPSYAEDHLFYVAYSGVDDPSTSEEDESGDWHLDEFRANGNTADPSSRRGVLTVEFPPTPGGARGHYGGQLQFGPDGYLYASTGDGLPQGDPNGNAQNLGLLLGKILRIDPRGSAPGEYTVPSDNPFAQGAGCADGCDEIWSYGLRHPWRFSFDRLTGDLAIGDVGWHLWEEVNFDTGPDPSKGDNFGWNCREGAHPGPGETSLACIERVGTFTEPVFEYPHVDSGPCSITGGYVIRDPALSGLYGRYLYADFCTGELRSLNLGLPSASDDRSEGLSVPYVTSFGEDADGRIYLGSFDGPVYRLTEAAGPTEPLDLPLTATPDARLLSLDLEAKRQRLKTKLTLFATASDDSTLVVTGRAIQKTAKEVAAGRKIKVRTKLKEAMRKRLREKLDENGKGAVQVEVTATHLSGATATDKVKVKLKD